uniref:Chemokine interleukin-8-like domain-containing protein n=1 Tax=Calidris pygmaea TaxID=425635 RepID=A0A8C3KJ63_9CHAR
TITSLALLATLFLIQAKRWQRLSVCLSALTDGVPTACCFSYQKRPVPRALITSVYITSSSCSQPGVILVTKKKNKELCADPRESWVQARLKDFQNLKN